MSLVFIERSEGYERAFEATLSLLEKSRLGDMLPGGRILVKPNLVTSDTSREGITTDVSIVDGLLHFLSGNGCRNIVVGEGCAAGPTHRAFEANGYVEVARRHGADLADLDTSEAIELDVPNPTSVRRLRVARVAYEADLRISVAKLKVHSIGMITGCLKNMMGCLTGKKWKLVVHADVQKRIVDLNRLVKPHFGLVDGIIGNEVEECDPNPVPMNVLIGGDDCVAVDSVSAECMGIGWNEVPYLALAEREGLGTADIERIEVSGESIENIRRRFKRESGPWTYLRTRSEIIAGKIYGSIRR